MRSRCDQHIHAIYSDTKWATYLVYGICEEFQHQLLLCHKIIKQGDVVSTYNCMITAWKHENQRALIFNASTKVFDRTSILCGGWYISAFTFVHRNAIIKKCRHGKLCHRNLAATEVVVSQHVVVTFNFEFLSGLCIGYARHHIIITRWLEYIISWQFGVNAAMQFTLMINSRW